jgi:signal transduction histidine kinase
MFPIALFEAAFDASVTGISLYEPVFDANNQLADFRLLYVNEAGLMVPNLDRSKVIGQCIRQFYPTSPTIGLFNEYIKVYLTGVPYRQEHHYSDVERWIDMSASKLGDVLFLSYSNISARKQAEIALHYQADRLRNILDASLNSVIAMTAIRDDTGQITDFLMDTVNKAIEKDLFVTAEAITGQRLMTAFPGTIDSGAFAVYVRVTNTGRAERFTQFYTDTNGLTGWFEVSAVKQEPDGVVLTFLNITDRKREEQQREQLLTDLTRSNDSLTSFAYIASHDLQEPLRKISSFSDVLIDQYGPQLGDGIDLLRRMQSASARMSVLIQDLLAYSRLSGQQRPFTAVDLKTTVADVLIDLETISQIRQAVVTVGALPTLPGDAIQLRQLFQNLISNALKFVPPNVPPVVAVTAEDQAGSWRISVSDNGIGFDAEKYGAKIFDPFQRLHGRSSAYTGTGIGLAIARKVVENHGGRISVVSTPGAGTTFTVFLPA